MELFRSIALLFMLSLVVSCGGGESSKDKPTDTGGDAISSVDTDGDGISDSVDTDDDNDGVADASDAFPLDALESVDTDNDGIGNNADTDDDNDGVEDDDDVFPLDSTESEDSDIDGIGDNADAYPTQSACHSQNQGNGEECYATWLPKQGTIQVAASADSQVYLRASNLDVVFGYDVATNSFQRFDVAKTDTESLSKIAYSSTHERLYMGFSDGRIAYLDSSDGQIKAFAQTEEGVNGLAAVGNFMLAQDSSGAWESHYIFNAQGEQTDWRDWNHYSHYYAWNETLNRVYFFRDTTSPNDLMYEDIDQITGLITASGETPYHGDYRISGPIVVSPDGNHVFIGAGDIYNAASLTYENSIGKVVNDALWLETSGLITLRQDSGTITLSRFDDNFLPVETRKYSGQLIKAFAQQETVVLLINNQGTLEFTSYSANDDIDGDSIPNSEDAFPNDPAASQDSDNDGYPDSWNPGYGAGDSTQTLILDAYPNDAACQLAEHGTNGVCDINAHISLTNVDELLENENIIYAFSQSKGEINRWDPATETFLNPILLKYDLNSGAPLSMAVTSDGSVLVGYDSGILYRYPVDGIGRPELVNSFSAPVQKVYVTKNHYLVVVGSGNYYRDYLVINQAGAVVDSYGSGDYSNDYEFVSTSQRFYWFSNSYNDYLHSMHVNEASGELEQYISFSYSDKPTSFMSISGDESLIVTGNRTVIRDFGDTPSTFTLPASLTLTSSAQLTHFIWLSEVAVAHYKEADNEVLTIYQPDLKKAIADVPVDDAVVSIAKQDNALALLLGNQSALHINQLKLQGDYDGDGIPLWWELAYGTSDEDATDAALDGDEDGLTNQQEYQAGSHPNNEDTDGDGLLDGDEVTELGLNPLLSDSDGDFMLDAWEVANGLDGNDASDAGLDSDNDGVSNYHEYLSGTDPQDINSVPGYTSDVLYSFEDSKLPADWTLSATPEFSQQDAYDGSISLHIYENATIEWSKLFNNVELEFFVKSECYSSYDKKVKVAVDDQEVLSTNIEQAKWQKLQVLLSQGYHQLTISIESSNNDCALYMDAVSASPMASVFDMGGNIVTQRDNTLYLYNYDSELERSVTIPGQLDYSDHARDIVVLDDGRIAVFNGTFSPVLSYYTPTTNTWKHIKAPSWSTINNGSYGGIDAIGSRVFTTNMSTSGNSPSGIVRFDLDDESVEYVSGPELEDLTVGLDGFIYGLRGSSVYKYNADSLSQIKVISVASARAIAVAENGDIFSVTWDGNINHYDSAGNLLNSLAIGSGFMDIALRQNGEIIASDSNGKLYTTTTELTSYSLLSLTGEFVDFVPDIDTDSDGLPDWWETGMGLDADNANDAQSDPDNDGLTALQEFALGTKENVADTDNDGLNDGVEHLEKNTDPLDADSDDDGLNDGLEVELETNPLITDSDNDGLSDADEHLTLGTDPLLADSDKDGMLDGYEIEHGLDALADDAASDLDGDGLSNLEEHNAKSNPNMVDTDGDSLNDYLEVKVHLTSPLLPDTDGDKLKDGWEVEYNFNPNDGSTASEDADNDAFSNLEEYFSDTDPTDILSFPQPTEWQTHQGNAGHTGYTPHILDIADFTFKWEKTIENASRLNPVTASDMQVFVSNNSYFGDQMITALNAETGEAQWEITYPGIHSINAPAFSEGKVYYQTGGHSDSFIRAVDAATGSLIFESTYGNQWSRYLAPTIFDGNVYMAGGSYGGTYAFDATSGAEQWFANGPQYDNFTPAVDEQYVYAFTTRLDIIDRLTGELHRTIDFPDFNWSGYDVNVATVLSPDNKVIVSQRGTLVVFDIQTNAVVWQRVNSGFNGQPSVADGIIYAVANGSLYAIDETSGENQWILGTHSYQSNVIITKTHIFVGDGASTYAIDRNTHQEVWNYPEAGHLSLSADGILYIAGTKVTAVSLQK